MGDLLVQAIFLTAANYLIVLYLTDVTVQGPFDLFERIRSWAGINVIRMNNIDGGEGEIVDFEHNGSFLAKVLSCHRCSSPYVAAGLVLLALAIGFVTPGWADIILWLAITGATIFLFDLLE